VEGIDEIIETATAVQLVFHARRDWLAEADEAAQEVAWKTACCARFLRSPEFKQRFGMKPGTLVMKAARQPPADVMSDLARIGADVEVGRIGMAGQAAPATVTCAVCGRDGFLNSQMSVTERGLTCNGCFSLWVARQDLRPSGAGSGGLTGSGNWTAMRIVIAIVVFTLLTALRHCH
jgi:hypothetical protein